MNILLIATHFNPGGISRYCLNLAKGLKQRGHNVWVASCGGEWVKDLEDSGIKHKYIPIRTKSILSPKIFIAMLKLRPFIREESIQIIHANTRVTQMLAYLLYKYEKIPYISSFHGFYNPKISRKMAKLCGLKSIAVSKAVKQHLVNDLSVDEAQVRVVYNGIDAGQFSTSPKKRIDFGFSNDGLVIGILGRISEEKGHFLAVEAIENLSNKGRNVNLAICGKGKLEDRLRKFISNKAIAARVRIVDIDADSFLDNIDLLVVPSRKEGFGYAILEAFVKEVSVIGFNVGGISEIIQDKSNGLLFFNYDDTSLSKTIEEIMCNDSLRAQIIENAKKSIALFSLENMAQNTEKVYQEVLK